MAIQTMNKWNSFCEFFFYTANFNLKTKQTQNQINEIELIIEKKFAYNWFKNVFTVLLLVHNETD